MATDAQLKVRIEAELKQFAKKMREAKEEVVIFSEETEKATSDIGRSFKIINDTKFTFGANYKAAISNVVKSNEEAAKSFKLINNPNFTFGANYKAAVSGASNANKEVARLSDTVKKSTTDFTKYNRVIQDAPYGLIGIANNLQELIPNIGLASVGINLLLTAVQFAQIGFVNWTRGLHDTKKAISDVNKTGAEYISTLGQLSGSRLKGSQDSAQEITTLRLLYKQYTDNNRSLSERKSAFNQLQQIYPQYFGNLKFEKEATEKTATAYETLTKSIIATAKARAFSDQIAANAIKTEENNVKIKQQEITAEQLIQKAIDRSEKNQRALNATYTEQQKSLRLTEDQIKKNNDAAAEQVKQSSIYLNIQSNIRGFKRENDSLTSNNLRLEREINAELAKGGTLTDAIVDKNDNRKESLSDLLKQLKDAKDSAYINRLEAERALALNLDSTIKRIGNKDTSKSFKPSSGTPPIVAVALGGKTPEQVAGDIYTPFDILKESLEYDFLPKLSSGFESFFNDILERGKFSFASLGQAILKTFASVLASEATQNIIGLLGGKNSKGEKIGSGGIISSISSILGKKASAVVLPILGGLAAGGLLASLLKKKKEPTPVTPAFNSYSNGSSTVNSDSFGGGSVVFQISGANLIGVLNRAGAKLQRYNANP